MPPCNPVWIHSPHDTLHSGVVYGVLPGWSLKVSPLPGVDSVRVRYKERDCALDTGAMYLRLVAGEVGELFAGDTLYFDVDGELGIMDFTFEGKFCAYVFRRRCGGGGWTPSSIPSLIGEDWAPLFAGKSCICNTTKVRKEGVCICRDDGDSFVEGPDGGSCVRGSLRVCRSAGLFLALAPYLPNLSDCRGGSCATWPSACSKAHVYYQPYGDTARVLTTCLLGALNSPQWCTAYDTASAPCNVGVVGISHDSVSGRPFFWLPSCAPPGYYWGVPFMSGFGNGGEGAIVEVVDTRVGWAAATYPPSSACVGDSVRLCAVVGGAAYVSSYTWTIGSQQVTVPVSGGLGGDTAVVCTTVVIPAGVGSLAVSFSVQYDTSRVFCPECCPGAGRSGCDGCFWVRDTIRVEAPVCVLVATPETVCVGEPVFFTVQRGACLDTAMQVSFTPIVGMPKYSVSPMGWSHTYLQAGVYQAEVEVWGRGGKPAICQVRVVVKARPQISLSGPARMCWNGQQPVACIVAVGPVLRGEAVYCAGYDPGLVDSVVWSVSCGGRSPVYSVNGGSLTILDWGSGRGGCQICVTAWRGGCSTMRCIWVEDNREGHGVEIQGPVVTCVDTVGIARYVLVDGRGQPWIPPSRGIGELDRTGRCELCSEWDGSDDTELGGTGGQWRGDRSDIDWRERVSGYGVVPGVSML